MKTVPAFPRPKLRDIRRYIPVKKLITVALLLIAVPFFSTCTKAEEDPDAAADCLNAMTAAVVEGDNEAGERAQRERDVILERADSDEVRISYSELADLSHFIASQANYSMFSDELRICVGEVALNRVASPDFPDSIEGVAAQYGFTREALDAVQPSRSCVCAALRLLQGHRLMGPEVLYMSQQKSGQTVALFYSRLRGYTYFSS